MPQVMDAETFKKLISYVGNEMLRLSMLIGLILIASGGHAEVDPLADLIHVIYF